MKINCSFSPRTLPALFLLASALLIPPLPAEASEDDASSHPRWGLTARAAQYGLPDWFLDSFFAEHPDVDGTMFGGEIRYYGANGPRGIFSVALTLDVGTTEGTGTWREDESDDPIEGGGGLDIIAGTLTLYWDILPSLPLHPYFGLGIGLGYAEASYIRDGALVSVEDYVPVLHIPGGLILNIGEHFGVSAEGRFINGFALGGTLQLRF